MNLDLVLRELELIRNSMLTLTVLAREDEEAHMKLLDRIHALILRSSKENRE